MDYLIYTGDGSALPDIPARNLSQQEAESFGVERLLASKLYVMAETPKTKASAKKAQEINNDNE